MNDSPITIFEYGISNETFYWALMACAVDHIPVLHFKTTIEPRDPASLSDLGSVVQNTILKIENTILFSIFNIDYLKLFYFTIVKIFL